MRVVARIPGAHRIEFVTGPLLSAAGLAMARPMSVVSAACAMAAFALAWPLAEWWMHRWLLHRVYRREHWHHHVDPTSDLHVLPLLSDAVLAVIAGALVLATGRRVGGALFGGFALGYVAFYYAHWFMHLGWWPSRGPLAAAARRHALHHAGIEANYNVLLPLGDWLFGTYASAPDR
jgi:hypothetical protein